MNAKEFITAMNLPNGETYREHAGKLTEIVKFIKSNKSEIKNIDTQPGTMFFGKKIERYRDNGKWEEREISEGTELPSLKIKFELNNGLYCVQVPTRNPIFDEVCKLLNIETEPETIAEVKVIDTYIFPESIFGLLQRAKNFCSKDEIRPAMTHVCLDIKNKMANVVATDAHQLFYSRDLMIIGSRKDRQILLSVKELKAIAKVKATEPVKLEILEGNRIRLAGHILSDVECCNPYPNWRAVVPNYKSRVIVDRVSLININKEVYPAANKSTSQVKFYFNGNIQLHSYDVDFHTENKARLAYTDKNVPDFTIALNGRILENCLKNFASDSIEILTEGKADRCVILTDKTDSVLLMPLMLND